MARSRDLKINIVGDADKLDREVRRSNKSLDKLGRQTRLTSSITSKGFAGMRVAAVGAAGALGGVAIAGKRVVEAAIEAEKSQTRLETQLKASGISYRAHAKEIDAVIKKHSQLAGVDDEDLQDAFTAIVRTTGSVSTAMRDMGVVTDLARAKNMDVAKAGEMVAKIHAGAVTPLKRMGIEFVKTTENVDRLKASQDKITPAQLAAAKAADVQANSQRALGLLQDKVKGQAEAYGKTTEGAMKRAEVAVEELEEDIGGALAPTVEKAANGLAKFVGEMQDGTGQGGRFAATLKDIWQDTKPIVTWIGRATKNVARFTAEHPEVRKLAASVVAVGLAVKGLRLVSAVTGFTALTKAGRGAARTLKRVLSSGGAAAGDAAAANAASNFSNKGGRFSSAGRKAGRLLGKGLIAGAVVGLAGIAAEITQKVKSELDAAGLWKPPGGKGSFWDNLIPTQLLPKVQPGEGILGKLFNPQASVSGVGADAIMGFGAKFGAKRRGGRGARATAAVRPGPRRRRGGAERVSPYDSAIAEADLVIAETEARTTGDPVGGSRAARREARAVSAKRRVVGARIRKVRAALRRQGLTPATRLRLTQELGELVGEHSQLGGTVRELRTAPPAERDDRAERQERAGSRIVNAIAGPAFKGRGGITSQLKVAAGRERVMGEKDIAYGQQERRFGQSDEDLGTAAGRAKRGDELKHLTTLKQAQLGRANARLSALKAAIGKLDGVIAKLRGQLRGKKRARGVVAARVRERLNDFEDRRIELAAEARSLGAAIADIKLDISDLAREAAEVAGTEDTGAAEAREAAKPMNRVADVLETIGLRERAGQITPEQANAERQRVMQEALNLQYGALTERERWQLQGDLLEAQKTATDAQNAATQALRDLKASIDQQNAIATSTVGIQLAQATRALGDMLSGELGQRAGLRGSMPGSGRLASVGNSRF